MLSGNYRQFSVSRAWGQQGRDTKNKDGKRDLNVIAKSLAFILKDLGAALMYFKQIGCHIKIYILEKSFFWAAILIVVPGLSKSASPRNFLEKQILRLYHRPSFRKCFSWFWCTLKSENHDYREWNHGGCFNRNILNYKILKTWSNLFMFNKNSQERQSKDGTVPKQCPQEHKLLLSFYYIIIRMWILFLGLHTGPSTSRLPSPQKGSWDRARAKVSPSCTLFLFYRVMKQKWRLLQALLSISYWWEQSQVPPQPQNCKFGKIEWLSS